MLAAAALARKGTFGPLLTVLSVPGPRWARQAGVNPSNCVAFQMVRDGLRAELVLATNMTHWRVVRRNNVRQMAGR